MWPGQWHAESCRTSRRSSQKSAASLLELSDRVAVRASEAWADALPDGAVMAGGGYVWVLLRQSGAAPVWVNVPDAITAVRRTRPFLTEPLLTWHESWPSWMMFKRQRISAVEILSAAKPDTPWWPEVEAHHRRYTEAHGSHYAGRTMPAPRLSVNVS